MGGFYGSVQLRTADRGRVLAAAGAVARELKIKCLVGPALNGWVGVYPDGHGQDHTVGERLAAAVGGHALHVLVHDDDVLAYWLWHDGLLVDRYWSAPGYFGDENRAEEEPLVGDPNRFAFVLDDAGRARLRELLRGGRPSPMESERLERLGRLLGVRQAVQSYECLKEDDCPPRTRRQFTEVPADPGADTAAAAERAAERKRRAAVESLARGTRKRLLADGLLLTTSERDGIVGPSVAAVADGLAVGWSMFHPRPAEVTFHRPPWKNPESGRGLDVPPTAWVGLSAAAERTRLAATLGQTIRAWDVSADDGGAWRHVADVDVGQAFGVRLSPDGATVAHARLGSVVGVDVATGRQAFAVDALDRAGLSFAPDGTVLAQVGQSLRLTDLSSAGLPTRDLFLGGIRPDTTAASQRAAALFLAARGIHLPTAGPGGQRPPPTRESVEAVRAFGFSRDGRWVWCGTDDGLRVFDRATLPLADGPMPAPRYRFDLPPTLPPAPTAIHAIEEDPSADAVLFGGGGGRVYRMDLETGDVVRLLVTPPGGCGVVDLALSADRSALAVASHRQRQPTRTRPAAFVLAVDLWDYQRLLADA